MSRRFATQRGGNPSRNHRDRHGRRRSNSRAGSGKRSELQRSLGGDQVEGRRAVLELLLAGKRKTKEIVLVADLDPASIIDDIIELADEAKVSIREVTRPKFEAMTRTEAPQGIMAKAQPLPHLELEDLLVTSVGVKPFLLVLDGITDPGNLGALLRAGECAGATGVVIPRHRAARITPTVTKSAAGAVEHLSIATVAGIPKALSDLGDRDVWSIGLDAVAATEVYEMSVADGPIALVLGAEGRGLSRLVRDRCDLLVKIPMLGSLDSLNVSSAASVACFEVARCRRKG